MPRGKHLRGVSSKEQRQYEHIKKSAQRSGRYGRRAKEVAARTVPGESRTPAPPKRRRLQVASPRFVAATASGDC